MSGRLFAALVFARAAFGIALIAAMTAGLPLLWYLPVERRWAFGQRPQGLGMAWYGATLAAVIAAAIAFAVTWLALRRARVGPRLVLAVARAGALVMLVDFVYFGWAMARQDIPPPPPCAELSQGGAPLQEPSLVTRGASP